MWGAKRRTRSPSKGKTEKYIGSSYQIKTWNKSKITLNRVYTILLELKAKIQKLEKVDKCLEDLEFARKVEEAYQKHEVGDFKVKSSQEFPKRTLNN